MSLHVHTSRHWKRHNILSHRRNTSMNNYVQWQLFRRSWTHNAVSHTHWTYRCHALCQHWCFLQPNPYWYNLLHSSDVYGYSTLCNCVLMYTHIPFLKKRCHTLAKCKVWSESFQAGHKMTLLPLIQTSSAMSRKREQLVSFATSCNIWLFCALYDFHSFRKWTL